MHRVFFNLLKISLQRLLYSIHNNEQFCIKRYRDLQSIWNRTLNSTPSKVTRTTESEKTERERKRGKSVAKEKGESTRRDGKRTGFLILLDEERNVSQDGRRNTDK